MEVANASGQAVYIGTACAPVTYMPTSSVYVANNTESDQAKCGGPFYSTYLYVGQNESGNAEARFTISELKNGAVTKSENLGSARTYYLLGSNYSYELRTEENDANTNYNNNNNQTGKMSRGKIILIILAILAVLSAAGVGYYVLKKKRMM